MRNEILDIFKETLSAKVSFIFILLFPIILLTGSSIINTSIVLMNVFFLIHVFNNKKFQIFNNHIFYCLLFLWAFLIVNTLLNNDFGDNYPRAFGFIRFIILIFLFSYFLSYENFKFKKIIFDTWSIIFIVVSLDLIFQSIFSFNTLGFTSLYPGRLGGFMGDELKIGHWYLCFSLIILSNYFDQPKKFYFFLFLIIVISFLIGERANFIRLLLAIFFLLTITRRLSFKALTIFIITICVTFFVINNTEGEKIDAFKKRYIDQIYNLFNHDSFQEANNDTNNNYTPMYVNAYYIFKDNKLLGVGLGSYLERSHKKFRIIKVINGYDILPNTHPHQYHFEILATLGLPGYIFIFSFLFYFLFRSFRFYIVNKRIINLSSFLLVFVFCLPLLPTGSFFTTYGASIFWLNFSLMNLGNFKNINY